MLLLQTSGTGCLVLGERVKGHVNMEQGNGNAAMTELLQSYSSAGQVPRFRV